MLEPQQSWRRWGGKAAVEEDDQAEAAELAGAGGTGGTGARAALEEQAAQAEREEPAVTGGTGGTGGKGGRGGHRREERPGAPAAMESESQQSELNLLRSRGPSFRNSLLQRQQISRFSRRLRTERAVLRFSTPTICWEGLRRSGASRTSFTFWGMCRQQTAEGSCHTLKVKMNRGGLNVRSRSGYCNTKSTNVLEGTPVEKQLEARATGTAGGNDAGRVRGAVFLHGAKCGARQSVDGDSFEYGAFRKGKRKVSRQPERAGDCLQAGRIALAPSSAIR